MAKCRMCEKDVLFAGEPAVDLICSTCSAEHAIPEGSPPLRPNIPCTRCHGRSFVRCLALRERAAEGGDFVREYVAPLAATYENSEHVTVFRGRRVRSPDVKKPKGVFEAYICRQCGFVELYARDAQEIPIGAEYATTLFEVTDAGPYRS